MTRPDRLRHAIRFLLQKHERAIAARVAGASGQELEHAYHLRDGAVDLLVDAIVEREEGR